MHNLNIITSFGFTKPISDITGSVVPLVRLVPGKLMLITMLLLSLMSANFIASGSDAHTHGVANLTLAFEKDAFEVQFESPAMSLLGFEHKPNTQQQKETVERTKALLKSPEKVFSIDGAKCSAIDVNVSIAGPAGQKLNDAHAHEHAHHSSDEQTVEHEQHEQTHSEVLATYVYKCIGNDTFRSVIVSLFDHFSGLEKIKVNWLTETQQGQGVLRPESSKIELK